MDFYWICCKILKDYRVSHILLFLFSDLKTKHCFCKNCHLYNIAYCTFNSNSCNRLALLCFEIQYTYAHVNLTSNLTFNFHFREVGLFISFVVVLFTYKKFGRAENWGKTVCIWEAFSFKSFTWLCQNYLIRWIFFMFSWVPMLTRVENLLEVYRLLAPKIDWYFISKIVLIYCEKNCFSEREKLLKFKAEGWEFAKKI